MILIGSLRPKGSGLVMGLLLGSGALSVALKASQETLVLPETVAVVMTLITLPTVVVGLILGIRQFQSPSSTAKKPPDPTEGD